MNVKHGHHTVPRALIELFSLDGKKVFKYRIKENKIIQTNPKDAFRRRHYHSVTCDDGTVDHNSIEGLFEKIEGPAIASIKNCISSGAFSHEDKERIAIFIALQHLRTPVARAITEKAILEDLYATALVLDASGRFDRPRGALGKHGQSLAELLEQGILKFEIYSPQVTMASLLRLDSVAFAIVEMNFCLMKSSTGNYFILGDNPVSVFDPSYEKRGSGLGFAFRDIEIALPVSCSYCILATRKTCPNLLEANKRHVREINRRSSIFASEEAVFPLSSKSVMELLRSYSYDTPGIDTSTLTS